MKKAENKIFLKTLFLSFLLICSFSIVSSAFAADALVPCGLEGKADCTLCHLVLGFKNIYDYLLVLLLSATTLVAVVAGVMYMVSSGDKGMIDKAKSALTYALTAMILALTAWLIINATLSALGYTKVSNWWTFECDTTQTVGPTPPGPTPPPGPGGTGDCGGVKGQTDACKYLTKDLESVLACIKGKMGGGSLSGAYIESIGALQSCSGSNYSKPPCVHIKNSCHYGGTSCAGQINASDLTGGDLNAIRQAATACGGFAIYNGTNYRPDGSTSPAKDHEHHVHVSPMNGCGCQ